MGDESHYTAKPIASESTQKCWRLYRDKNASTIIYDNEGFNAWLGATLDGKKALAQFYERRFRAEYRPAFSAWLATDPFKSKQPLPGPIFMPEYHRAKQERSAALSQQAMNLFKRGTDAGDTGDQYVRITVILATVLLVTAIGQRFHVKAGTYGIYDRRWPVTLFSIRYII